MGELLPWYERPQSLLVHLSRLERQPHTCLCIGKLLMLLLGEGFSLPSCAMRRAGPPECVLGRLLQTAR